MNTRKLVFSAIEKILFVGRNRKISIAVSVTKFGEISPLGQNVKQLWQMFKGPLSIWQNFEHTWANFLRDWVNFQCCNWPNIEKVI